MDEGQQLSYILDMPDVPDGFDQIPNPTVVRLAAVPPGGQAARRLPAQRAAAGLRERLAEPTRRRFGWSGWLGHTPSVGPQILTLVGVAVGGLISFATAVGLDRLRAQREERNRWTSDRFESYAAYLAAAKREVALAQRIHAGRPLPHPDEDRLAELDAAEVARSLTSEKVVLLCRDTRIVESMVVLNQTVWLYEAPARRGELLGQDGLNSLASAWARAVNDFQEAARAEIGLDQIGLLDRTNPRMAWLTDFNARRSPETSGFPDTESQ